MRFVYPEFLFALTIPVIIHLFNFRKFRKIYFTNVRFLQEIKKDTDSRTRLKHLLVLLSRLLALTFLVFAFAKPFIPGLAETKISETRRVSIFLDNSFSMEAVGTNGKLIDEAKTKAKEIVSAYGSSAQFQLLTNDFEARHQRLYSKEETMIMIDEIAPGSSVKKLSEIVSHQSEALREKDNSPATSFILSDFQKSICDFESLKQDSMIVRNIIPLSAQQNNNLYIDSCYINSPVIQQGRQLELMVMIKNNSEHAAENIPCKLFINGKQKGLNSFSLEAGGILELKIPFTASDTGLQSGQVEIPDYPVTFDDTYYFSFEVAARLPVLCIHGEKENKFIDGVYKSDSLFELKNVEDKKLEFSSFASDRMIILDELKNISSGLGEELKKYMDGGGTLVIFPAVDADLISYNTFLTSVNAGNYGILNSVETKIESLNTLGDLMQNVFEKIPENMDVPLIKKHFTLSAQSKIAGEILISMQNRDAFLTRYKGNKNTLYLFTSPANTEYSAFPKHALFVPVMFRMALLSKPNSASSILQGNDQHIATEIVPTSGETVFHIKKTEGSFDIIPENKSINGKLIFNLHGQVKDAGNYLVWSTKPLAALSFNYDRKESQLDCYRGEELYEKSGLAEMQLLDVSNKSFGASLREAASGKQLWKYCILAALLFLAFEIVLLRLWK